MFLVKYGNKWLHDPRKSVFVTDAVVENELNSSSSFKFTIVKEHPSYNAMREHDMENEVTVWDGDDLIFRGTIVKVDKNFQLTAEVTCRGELAYLNDSLVPPYSTTKEEPGETVPNTLGGLFQWLIEQHNEQVDDARKFLIGEIDSSVSRYEIYSNDSSYPSTGSVIKEVILGDSGAYVYITHEGGNRYIHLVSDFEKVNSQVIDFGVNLLDFTDSDVSEDVISALVPLGASIKDTEYPYLDGYYLTADKTPVVGKKYYSANKCVACDSEMQEFEAGKTYYEKHTRRTYSKTKDSKPSTWKTYYTRGNYSKETHLLFFEYGITYYVKSGSKYKKTTDTKPKYSKEYYVRKYSSVRGIAAWESNTTYYELTSETSWYAKTSDSQPIYGKDYYEANNSGKSEVTEELTSFDPLKDYYEYDGNMDESNMNLDLSYFDGCDVAEGYYVQGNRIVFQEAFDKYGYIGGVCENTDLRDVDDLLDYGILYLQGNSAPVKTLEIKAVDLAMLKPDYDPIRVGQYIRARSKPHALDSYFLCSKVTVNLDNPSQNTFVLGANYSTLTDAQSRRIAALNSRVSHVYQKAEAISQEAKDSADAAARAEENTSVLLDALESGELKGEDGVVLRIDSSRGTVFKNNAISTVLSAVIYKGSDRITDITKLREVFGIGAYIQWSWQKLDEEAFGIILSTDPMVGDDGFTLTISPDEVDEKVNFMCELIN